ncbi:MAG: hypothetical protein Q4G58_14655 [bacterium]|nr:hypothetical protein [bacterium]
MPKLELTLTEGKLMKGIGEELVGWNISILLSDISKYNPEGELLVDVALNISNQPKVIQIAQRRAYSDIVVGEPFILPLEGTLWLVGKSEDTILNDYSVHIYYEM